MHHGLVYRELENQYNKALFYSSAEEPRTGGAAKSIFATVIMTSHIYTIPVFVTVSAFKGSFKGSFYDSQLGHVSFTTYYDQ